MSPQHNSLRVALLTGADDANYAHELAASLAAGGVEIDFIGSNEVRPPSHPAVRFLNLRGDQSREASALAKARRILRYYSCLFAYAATARPRLFHILWNNKFEHFDRTLLMAWYRLAGRKVLLTAHNVNAARRDGRDSAWNRCTLRIQYRLCEHIFVHTEKMRAELLQDFAVPHAKASVIPFPTPDVTPCTDLSREQARRTLGLDAHHKVLLFFGQIVPYKGLEYLLRALQGLVAQDPGYRLLVAGKVKPGHEAYWRELQALMQPIQAHVDLRIEHVPEAEVEVYFKAADALVLPYAEIFQSGVLFLAYRFGLPVVATDVGSFRDDVVEGVTGHVCAARDAPALAACIRRHFDSPLGRGEAAREAVRVHARERHSWSRVAAITERAYRLLAARGTAAAE
jgi:glycosyltransferase involved in cell wall biosynthesis